MKKNLKDLDLLDRFLFAEAMEDSETMQMVLEIILGRDILMKYDPQPEKEQRTFPLKKYIKLDVWAQDMEETVYDTEVQKRDTGNLPKRSRFYQGVIDSGLLKSGEADFNQMSNVFIILIMPFDLFGKGQYMYTFQMGCKEEKNLLLDDGATRIFLNTQGKKPKGISQELRDLLHYMEHSDAKTSKHCKSDRIHRIHTKIQAIKDSEEVGVRYMQEWEERVLEKQEARAEGEALGEKKKLVSLVSKKLAKGYSAEEIAELLEEDVQTIQEIAQSKSFK